MPVVSVGVVLVDEDVPGVSTVVVRTGNSNSRTSEVLGMGVLVVTATVEVLGMGVLVVTVVVCVVLELVDGP